MAYEMRSSDWSSDVCSSVFHRPEEDRGADRNRGKAVIGVDDLSRRIERPLHHDECVRKTIAEIMAVKAHDPFGARRGGEAREQHQQRQEDEAKAAGTRDPISARRPTLPSPYCRVHAAPNYHHVSLTSMSGGSGGRDTEERMGGIAG